MKQQVEINEGQTLKVGTVEVTLLKIEHVRHGGEPEIRRAHIAIDDSPVDAGSGEPSLLDRVAP